MSKSHLHESHKAKAEETEPTENTETGALAASVEEATAEAPATEPAPEQVKGLEKDGFLTNPGQIEAYHKHEKMQWENESDAKVAELVTKFAFGDKKGLVKLLKGAKAKEIEAIKVVAKKLEFDSLLTDEILAEHI